MTTPVWVITGLLDSGKTTLINQLIEQELDEQDILVIQFESGETPLTEQERVKEFPSALRIQSLAILTGTALI